MSLCEARAPHVSRAHRKAEAYHLEVANRGPFAKTAEGRCISQTRRSSKLETLANVAVGCGIAVGTWEFLPQFGVQLAPAAHLQIGLILASCSRRASRSPSRIF